MSEINEKRVEKKVVLDDENYLGSYNVEKCEAYGAAGIIDKYNNNTVTISLKEKTNEVVVTSNTDKLGVLSLGDVEKKVLIPYLKQGWCSTLYSCKLMVKKDEKPKVGIWVNERK